MKEILIAVMAAFLMLGCTGYGQGAAASPQSPAGAAAPAGTGQQGASGTPQAGSSGGSGSQPGSGTNGAVKFSDSKYASNAVQIYPGSTNGPSSGEVPNFDMATAAQADGSVKVTMTEKAGASPSPRPFRQGARSTSMTPTRATTPRGRTRTCRTTS